MEKKDKRIDDAKFSVRLANALKVAGISTVYEALEMPIEKLLRIPHLGNACISELYSYAKKHNLLYVNKEQKEQDETYKI